MRKKEEMRKMVERFGSSGQTRTSFCRAEGINLYTFIYWQEKFKDELKSPSFVVLEKPNAKYVLEGLELEFPNGVKLRNCRDLELIRQLILWDGCSV